MLSHDSSPKGRAKALCAFLGFFDSLKPPVLLNGRRVYYMASVRVRISSSVSWVICPSSIR